MRALSTALTLSPPASRSRSPGGAPTALQSGSIPHPMAPRLCGACATQRPVLRRPKTGEQLCRECFYTALEAEVHETITRCALFRRGERVAIAASGGKDSTVLAHMVTLLNERHE